MPPASRAGRRWLAVLFATAGVYSGAYLVLRAVVEPAANAAYFVYPGGAAVDACCYHSFWPAYKADRFLTGRKHNLDRRPFAIADGDAGT